VQQALTLQCSLQSKWFGTSYGNIVPKPLTYEVILYGIELPPDAAAKSSGSNQHNKKVFVGIKQSTLDQGIPDAAETAQHHSEDLGSRHREADAVDVTDSVSVVYGRRDLEVAAGQHAELDCSGDSPHLSRGIAFPRTPSVVAAGELHEGYDAISSLVFTQSAESEGVEKCSVGVQTADTQALPPIFPPKEHLLASHAAKQTGFRAPVKLQSSKVVVPAFKETPTTTVKWLIKDTLVRFNPRGKGCCSWHIRLRALIHHAVAMRNAECEQIWDATDKLAMQSETGEWLVLQTWQCQRCFSLNEEDIEDQDDKVCLLCMHEIPREEEESAREQEQSGCEADVESCELAADDESLTGEVAVVEQRLLAADDESVTGEVEDVESCLLAADDESLTGEV
jgi:hypothetical protein